MDECYWIGNHLKILSLNIEGCSQDKSEYLNKILSDHSPDVICLQETHSVNDSDLLRRCSLPNYELVDAIHDRRFGTVFFRFINNKRL